MEPPRDHLWYDETEKFLDPAVIIYNKYYDIRRLIKDRPVVTLNIDDGIEYSKDDRIIIDTFEAEEYGYECKPTTFSQGLLSILFSLNDEIFDFDVMKKHGGTGIVQTLGFIVLTQHLLEEGKSVAWYNPFSAIHSHLRKQVLDLARLMSTNIGEIQYVEDVEAKEKQTKTEENSSTKS